jgi:predicted RNA-binding Zn-ribbon protein involved in translation (DUF1610 family)
MSIAVKSEGERRQDECLHTLVKLAPPEDGFRWRCTKCGKYLYRKNGIVIQGKEIA